MAVAAEISPQTTSFELWETELEQSTETRKSFDPLASARMLRYDLANFGQVLPETRERVMNEELSYLVEGIGRAARTTFVLRRQEGELRLFDRGQWRSYSGMLMTGLKTAKDEALKDPRRQFLAERAREDLQHAYQMQGLQPGQQYTWYSSYPHQEAVRYGEAFMKNCGFVPEREMGFLYRASCNEDGDIVLESQTVDRSDEEAFEAAMGAAGQDTAADMDTLLRTYDGALAKKYGERFYAGRRGGEMENNAWQELRQQRDLIEYFLDKLEALAAAKLPGHELERNIKKHVYGVWAAFKRRLDNKVAAPDIVWKNNVPVGHWAILDQEVNQAFNQFAREGRVLVGCGGSVSMLQGEENVLNAEGKDVFDAVFGGKNTSETYKFDKKMYCVVCQAPPKESEPKKMCGPCGICKKCDAGLKRKSAK